MSISRHSAFVPAWATHSLWTGQYFLGAWNVALLVFALYVLRWTARRNRGG